MLISIVFLHRYTV